MKFIDFQAIRDSGITPFQCVEWVKEAFLNKYNSDLPTKISQKKEGNIFFNTMPAELPYLNRFGVKVVSRFPARLPTIQSDILLYDSQNGDSLALMDGTWITTMRTGAVAALTALTFQKSDNFDYSFIGLGNTARATLLCLLSQLPSCQKLRIRVLAHKQQEEDFIQRFSQFENLEFIIYSSVQEQIQDASVVFSCVTATNGQFAADSCYSQGVLVIPVHTKGFQNCDLFFDKVFVDDIGHVQNFKYFSNMKCVEEFSNVLLKKTPGRLSNAERILAYNIGIALHDVYFASKIYDILTLSDMPQTTCPLEACKFWV